MSEENKAIVQRVYEQIFNQGNLDQIEELISPDIVDHEAPPPGMEGLEDIEVLRQFLRACLVKVKVEPADVLGYAADLSQ